MNRQSWFNRFAKGAARAAGAPMAFMLAVMVMVVWALSGPLFGLSDTWQLVINTGTTIVTFLMVFLIQATQNRDAKAIHLKLDELLRGVEGARTHLVDLEHLDDEELELLQKQFERLHERATHLSPQADTQVVVAPCVEDQPAPEAANDRKPARRRAAA